MKTSSIRLILVVTGFVLCMKPQVIGQIITSSKEQDSYGSSCNLGRQLFVIKNKQVVEFLAPIGWRMDYSQLRSAGIERFYPEIDSINRETNIIIYQSPVAFTALNIDSIIQSHNGIYPKNWDVSISENQDNLFSRSVPNGRLYNVKDNERNMKEALAYVFSDDFIVTFNFKPSGSNKYSEYIDVFLSLLSSIKCSNITGQK